MPLSEQQIHALMKLDEIADEMLREYFNRRDYMHEERYQKLAAVKLNVKNVLEYHDNKYCVSSVQGSLNSLRAVVKYFNLQKRLKP